MRGTDITEAQLRSARQFLADRQQGHLAGCILDDGQPVTIPYGQMARMIAWYGALRYVAGRDGTGGTFEEPGPIGYTKEKP